MDIPINAEVFCIDGLCGHTTYIVMNPVTKKVTHVVVKEKNSPHTERLVPESLILKTSPTSIHLRCSQTEFATQDEFIEHHFVRANLPVSHPVMGTTAYWPYAIAQEKTFVTEEERIPPNELAIHRGAKVEARDFPVGWVDEFLVNPTDGKISHLILREGHLWGQKDVTIPVSLIDHIEEDTIYLNIDKQSIEKLPAIPVHHWSL